MNEQVQNHDEGIGESDKYGYAEAKQKVESSVKLAPHADFILADWDEGDEHLRWVCTADEKTILDWILDCNDGQI